MESRCRKTLWRFRVDKGDKEGNGAKETLVEVRERVD